MPGFDKILIANRGEIACRIIRTAHAMGYATVAVFSDADADALHARVALESVHVGASPPAESYLNIGVLLDAAMKTGAGAVHPGYGFLAESAEFAEACEAAGLVFAGPPAEVIRALGDKARAKAIAADAGLPVIPGYMGLDQSSGRLQSEAARLGYPLMIKAVAGGGGRGIRAVASAETFRDGVEAARREAAAAFGDDRLMLEKLIEAPRHIEVQLFGDAYGNVVHLFERDCTVQRRRQKIIEEAPSPSIGEELRSRITSYATALARRAGYRNAGTAEFIADGNSNIYFLEVNARLQVEHPVTEMLTGIDLVEWQLRVAAGECLPLRQEEITRTGHAIEVRLCAEDPEDGFRPQTGDVLFWRPDAAAGVRIDSGIAEGGRVSPFYDSMIAKFIAHGTGRSDAVRKLRSSLTNTPLLGLTTNKSFLLRLLDSPEFDRAALSTTSLESWIEAGHESFQKKKPSPEMAALAAALFAKGSKLPLSIELLCQGQEINVRYRCGPGGVSILETEGAVHEITVEDWTFPAVVYSSNAVRRRAIAVLRGWALHLGVNGDCFVFKERTGTERSENPDADGSVHAPVAGRIAKVFVEEGEPVAIGAPLAVIEAMKMEIRVAAPCDGVVALLAAVEGAQVAQGAIVCEIERAGGSHE